VQSNAQFDSVPPFHTRQGYSSPCIAPSDADCCSLRRYDSMSRLVVSAPPAGAGGLRVRTGNTAAGGKLQAETALKVFGSEAAGAVILSGVAGYVDAAGFMALYGLFTAHITGDLVTAGTTLTERLRLGEGTRLVMIPIFMASVAATTLFARRLHRSGRTALGAMLTLLTIALAIFAITGATLRPLADEPDAWAVVIIGGAGVIAMGIQNTLMRNVLSSYSPTTFMTGNLTQCTIELVEMALPDPTNDTLAQRLARGAARLRLKKFGLPLLGFMLGVLSGACLTQAIGLASIAAPALAVGLLSIHACGSSACQGSSRGTPEASGLRVRLPCTMPRAEGSVLPWPHGLRGESCSALSRKALRPAHTRSGTYLTPADARTPGLVLQQAESGKPDLDSANRG